jgi:plasmid maintenance system antidote protein VapI
MAALLLSDLPLSRHQPDLWMNLQAAHDLSKAKMDLASRIEREVEVFSPS